MPEHRVPKDCKPMMEHIANCEKCVVTIRRPGDEVPNPDPYGDWMHKAGGWRVHLCPAGIIIGQDWWDPDRRKRYTESVHPKGDVL